MKTGPEDQMSLRPAAIVNEKLSTQILLLISDSIQGERPGMRKLFIFQIKMLPIAFGIRRWDLETRG